MAPPSKQVLLHNHNTITTSKTIDKDSKMFSRIEPTTHTFSVVHPMSFRVAFFQLGINNTCMNCVWLHFFKSRVISPWAHLVAPWYRICLPCRRCGFDPQVREIPWRRKWQPTPVFLLGKSCGQRSLGELQSMGSRKSWTQLSN